jgi:hypothetical protein
MHSAPTVTVEELREAIIETAADKAEAQTDEGRKQAQAAAIERVSALASIASGNELLYELGAYLNQLKQS